MKLAIMTKEEFEATIGRTFGTVGTTKGCAYSEEPMYELANGSKAHGAIVFDSYEDYLKHLEEYQ